MVPILVGSDGELMANEKVLEELRVRMLERRSGRIRLRALEVLEVGLKVPGRQLAESH